MAFKETLSRTEAKKIKQKQRNHERKINEAFDEVFDEVTKSFTQPCTAGVPDLPAVRVKPQLTLFELRPLHCGPHFLVQLPTQCGDHIFDSLAWPSSSYLYVYMAIYILEVT